MSPTPTQIVLLVTLIAGGYAVGCSRSVGAGDNVDVDGATPDGATLTDTGPAPDAAVDAGTDPPTDCEELRWWLSGEINGGTSTVVIRFDAIDYEPLGWHVFGSPASQEMITESQARTAASQAVSWPLERLMFWDETAPVYIFMQDHDTGGETVVVSAWSPLPVFAAGMRYNESGAITYPTTWRDPVGLGVGCVDDVAPYPSPSLAAFSTWFYPPSTIPPEDVAALENALAHTLIIRAWTGGYFIGTTAVRWVACLAPVQAETMEWIVILSGAWLV